MDLVKTTLRQTLKPQYEDKESQLDSFIAMIDFNDLLMMNAQRKNYGHTPKQFDLYTDETRAALWTWELASPSLYLDSAYLKTVMTMRQSQN